MTSDYSRIHSTSSTASSGNPSAQPCNPHHLSIPHIACNCRAAFARRRVLHIHSWSASGPNVFSTGRAASGFVWPVGSGSGANGRGPLPVPRVSQGKTGGGRNPYAPLPDRVMWTLPELALSSFPDEALRCADWLISIRPFMNDLSPASAEWWSPVEREADDLYMRWQMASPLDRIRIVPEASRRCKLRRKGLRRVRSRQSCPGAGASRPGCL